MPDDARPAAPPGAPSRAPADPARPEPDAPGVGAPEPAAAPAGPAGGRSPLRRALRLAALLAGPARAHRADLWPRLAIDRPGGAVRWAGAPLLALEPPSALVPAGLERIVVVGAGPSLRRQSPERLAPGTALLLNGAAVLATRLRPLAVVVEDERFVARHLPMLAAVPPGVPFLLSPAALRAVAERDPDTLRRRPVALLDNLAKPVNARRRGLDDPGLDAVLVRGPEGGALSRDPDRGVVIVGTVAFTALQVAMAARPAAVTLAGVDLANADAEPRFYERAGASAPSGLVRGLPRIRSAFALALAVSRGGGPRLTCASPASLLLDLGYPHDPILG